MRPAASQAQVEEARLPEEVCGECTDFVSLKKIPRASLFPVTASLFPVTSGNGHLSSWAAPTHTQAVTLCL